MEVVHILSHPIDENLATRPYLERLESVVFILDSHICPSRNSSCGKERMHPGGQLFDSTIPINSHEVSRTLGSCD